jgi:hypothetical protein
MNLLKIAENEHMTTYIDLNSIKNQGALFQFAEIVDFKNAKQVEEGVTARSHLLHSLINCDTGEQSILKLMAYSENMGSGEVVHEGTPKENVRKIPDDSLSFNTLNFLRALYKKNK